MNLLRHPAAAFLIFGVVVALYVGIYTGFEDTYGITRDQVDEEGLSIMERLQALNLVQGMTRLSDAIQSLKDASFVNALDLLGALASAGTAVLQIVGGIVTIPLDIFAVIFVFYSIPPIVATGVGALVVLYIGFIILSAYLRTKV